MQNLNLNSKLTLQQFIQLFNSEDENRLWDMFMLTVYNDDESKPNYDWSNVKIVPRYGDFTSGNPSLETTLKILKSDNLI